MVSMIYYILIRSTVSIGKEDNSDMEAYTDEEYMEYPRINN